MTEIVRADDGRRIAVEQSGDPSGRPVFLLHGTPGSRMGPAPRGMLLYRLGIRLIAFDRPGYGGSDRLEGRDVAAAAVDVLTIAEALKLDTFALVGRSGGGPHALAAAALLPGRVTRVAALVSLAPQGAEGLDWYEGMTESNVVEYNAAASGVGVLETRLAPKAAAIRANPESLISGLYQELSPSDRQTVADLGIRRMLVDNFAEGLKHSAYGWIDDAMAFSKPWGFDPADIAVPTLLWHGALDGFSPVGHARWLADRIPDAKVIVQPGVAHFGALDILPDMLPWLVES